MLQSYILSRRKRRISACNGLNKRVGKCMTRLAKLVMYEPKILASRNGINNMISMLQNHAIYGAGL
jgi:hypothetical protein